MAAVMAATAAAAAVTWRVGWLWCCGGSGMSICNLRGLKLPEEIAWHMNQMQMLSGGSGRSKVRGTVSVRSQVLELDHICNAGHDLHIFQLCLFQWNQKQKHVNREIRKLQYLSDTMFAVSHVLLQCLLIIRGDVLTKWMFIQTYAYL